jgi:hypothetical protein
VKRAVAISAAALLAMGGIGFGEVAHASSGQGHADAVAEVEALLAEAPTLASAVPSATSPVAILDQAPQVAAYDQLVQRATYWTIDESWKQAYADPTATTPSGLTEDGNGTVGGRTLSDDMIYASYHPKTLPAGIAYAELQVALAPDGKGMAAIGIYGQAVPQPVRPKSEIVPSSLKRAHVVVRNRSGDLVRGNTVTGAAAATLVKDFNALPVDPPSETSCPADSGRREIVTFRADGHTIVATVGFCYLVGVTRDGHRLATLTMRTKFGKDISADLAPVPAQRPKRPAAEHVPLSVHRVHIVRRNELQPTPAKTVTVTGKPATRLVRAFDAMKTQPTTYVHCNIAGGPEDVVTFRGVKHTWVVKEAACTNIVVTRDGKSLPTLLANTAWNHAIAHDLAI